MGPVVPVGTIIGIAVILFKLFGGFPFFGGDGLIAAILGVGVLFVARFFTGHPDLRVTSGDQERADAQQSKKHPRR